MLMSVGRSRDDQRRRANRVHLRRVRVAQVRRAAVRHRIRVLGGLCAGGHRVRVVDAGLAQEGESEVEGDEGWGDD